MWLKVVTILLILRCCFLMGMVIFAEAGVDYVTLETGLGGRLDATTAVEKSCGLRDHIYQSGSYAVFGKYGKRDCRGEGWNHCSGSSCNL